MMIFNHSNSNSNSNNKRKRIIIQKVVMITAIKIMMIMIKPMYVTLAGIVTDSSLVQNAKT